MASFSRPSLRCLATCGANSFDWFLACVKVKMRSIATPNDHIDMMKSTTATPLATYPICAHIAIMSTVHPPSNCVWSGSGRPRFVSGTACGPCHHLVLRYWLLRDRLLRSGLHYCSVKLTVTVMMTGTGCPLSVVGV